MDFVMSQGEGWVHMGFGGEKSRREIQVGHLPPLGQEGNGWGAGLGRARCLLGRVETSVKVGELPSLASLSRAW